MSDLQVSLLIIGAIVVGGVTAFNWFQQWRLRRKLEVNPSAPRVIQTERGVGYIFALSVEPF